MPSTVGTLKVEKMSRKRKRDKSLNMSPLDVQTVNTDDSKLHTPNDFSSPEQKSAKKRKKNKPNDSVAEVSLLEESISESKDTDSDLVPSHKKRKVNTEKKAKDPDKDELVLSEKTVFEKKGKRKSSAEGDKLLNEDGEKNEPSSGGKKIKKKKDDKKAEQDDNESVLLSQKVKRKNEQKKRSETDQGKTLWEGIKTEESPAPKDKKKRKGKNEKLESNKIEEPPVKEKEKKKGKNKEPESNNTEESPIQKGKKKKQRKQEEPENNDPLSPSNKADSTTGKFSVTEGGKPMQIVAQNENLSSERKKKKKLTSFGVVDVKFVEKHGGDELTSDSKNEVSSRINRAIEYLRVWKNNRKSWKYNKNFQELLSKALYNPVVINEDNFKTALLYFEGIKGLARERLKANAMDLIKEDDPLVEPLDESVERRAREILQILG